MFWPRAPRSAKQDWKVQKARAVSPDQVQSLFALAIGFAVAGVLATGYQALTRCPASFGLLQRGPGVAALAAVPLVIFAAPFIIMRNTIRGREIEDRPIPMVMIATVIAGFWSLISGSVMVMALHALGVLAN
jgi:hypothetical protein